MPGSPLTTPSWALLLRLLALLRPPGLGEACSCAPAHPQQHVCHSALVIRAKISSEKVVPASADPDDTQKMIRYEIKQIKMFKGFEKVKDVQYIYTPFDSSLCGVKLEANSQKQYLLTEFEGKKGAVSQDPAMLVPQAAPPLDSHSLWGSDTEAVFSALCC
ncbi:metalloproteinase inhibitor 4 isoform X2 [Ochotona princeps]|uniref:metalloproteinase inhibitor 4 isoform X2 n=1 Tax=Ochotona princeps TaxID=9978 RepID=UPI0027144E7A|nr:metalloproteinase inhibitor 4 isoform X2 [Ochotona princeps]